MTDIVSAVTGKLSRSLTLGMLLPAALFVVLTVALVGPHFQGTVPLQGFFGTLGLGDQWSGIALLFWVILLGGLLFALNSPIIRFYEGYPWRNSWIGRWRTRHYVAQFGAHRARWKGMITLQRRMEASDERGKVIDKWAEIGRRLKNGFPENQGAVLPTRLGNVIRSREQYPLQHYRMDTIILWPRLVAKVSKEYAAVIDEAKASFDFMLNCSALSAVLALEILVVGLLYLPLDSPDWFLIVPEMVVFGILSHIFYRASIGRASLWGATLASAFDLYRWDLLKQLGYTYMPPTVAEEQAFWDTLCRRILYPPLPRYQPYQYYTDSTFAFAKVSFPRGNPTTARLEVARGVDPPAEDGRFKITLRVSNKDGIHPAEEVVVTDTVPDGFAYQWNSASCDDANRTVEVDGANPYSFHIGNLKPLENAELTYDVVPYLTGTLQDLLSREH